ncbi:MAG: zinc ribbon domain-containing protein [Prevotella sp.]
MALIHCPKCGQIISDQAVNCPKCGAMLSGVASTDQRPAYTQVSAQSSQYVRPTAQDEPK